MTSKQSLRQAIRQRRAGMTPGEIAEKSEALCRLVLESEAYARASTIYCYLPFRQEVDTLPLLRQALRDGRQVAIPKCFGKEMRFVLVTDLSQIRAGAFGAPEPIADGPVASDEEGLMIVPGLAFDSRGYRIGYGGGYYDRYLSAHPRHTTVALCFDFQVLPRLEPEDHDIPVQTIFFR